MHAISNKERFSQFDDQAIEALVHGFYGRVQVHPELAPVFDARIEDWPLHLGRMVAFWTTILRGERVYIPHERGGPPQLHQAMPELEREHFKTWLGLWRTNAEDLFEPELVEHLMGRAQNMAHVLSRHIADDGTVYA